ncbi:metalloprotease [Candidatus Woesearchaeota archaeon]|nr:metalloprotease [Candidatus Woesearchaeota archaeon]
MYSHKPIKIGKFQTSNIELIDLFKAWVVISLAFTLVLAGFDFSIGFGFVFLMSAFTVGIGFLFHELGHKILAQKYGCFAEFRANNRMLLMAILFSLFGFVFAAPGAVMISGQINQKQRGIISAAGPMTNLVIALIFLGLFMTSPIELVRAVSSYGYLINTWLALFNMLPFGIFDGAKIFRWNKILYVFMASLCVGLLLVRGFL